jgi:hypothetical protein
MSSLAWILIVSGLVTAGGGFAALISPRLLLRLGFGVESPQNAALFFVRHWGVLIVAVAALIVYGAYNPEIRTPILVAAAVEKFAIGFFVFFGPLKRTIGMTAVSIVDGLFAILYVVYLVQGSSLPVPAFVL